MRDEPRKKPLVLTPPRLEGEYYSFDEYKTEIENALKRFERACGMVSSSEDLPSISEFLSPSACLHTKSIPVKRRLANGVMRTALQCVACGRTEMTGVKNSDYPNVLDEHSAELEERARALQEGVYTKMRDLRIQTAQAIYKKLQELTELEQLAQNQEWWIKYSEYLKSPEWQSKRARVLKRDDYTCQACLKREASQAHHLTYKRVFNEPLFDLVAICGVCHEGLHPHMQQGAKHGDNSDSNNRQQGGVR